MTNLLYGANVQANGIRQHYLRYGGRGPEMVLVPGITSPAVTWGFVAERLAERFDVYVPDARGRGLSESGPGLTHALEDYAGDLAGFVAALGIGPVALVGHSMGARIVLRAMTRHGAALSDRVVLVDPPVSGPGRRDYPTPLNWYLDAILLAQSGADVEALRPFTPTWTDDQIRIRAEWLHTCDPAAVEASWRSFHEDDIHGDIAALKAEAMLLAAGRGGVIQPEDLSEIRSLNPGLHIRVAPYAGHMIPWDDLTGFLDPVTDFLTSTPSPSASASTERR